MSDKPILSWRVDYNWYGDTVDVTSETVDEDGNVTITAESHEEW